MYRLVHLPTGLAIGMNNEHGVSPVRGVGKLFTSYNRAENRRLRLEDKDDWHIQVYNLMEAEYE